MKYLYQEVSDVPTHTVRKLSCLWHQIPGYLLITVVDCFSGVEFVPIRAVSSTVPVTAVPGTIQVLLYLTKDLVFLARYFVPCTNPGTRYYIPASKVLGTWSGTLYLVPGLGTLYLSWAGTNRYRSSTFSGTLSIWIKRYKNSYLHIA